MSYSAFLERKARAAADVGPDIDPGEVHPALFEWNPGVV